jgi:tetratricopeptide (TPR) repeat protein
MPALALIFVHRFRLSMSLLSHAEKSVERFCQSCGARKLAASAQEKPAQYCQSCGAPQFTHPQNATAQAPPQNALTPSRSFIGACVVVFALGSLSFGVTRLMIDKAPEGGGETAAHTHNASGEAQSGKDGNPMAKVSPEIQQRIAELRDSLAAEPNNPRFVLQMANAWYDAGAFFQAEQFYARYLREYNPKDVAARVDYAYTILRQGRPEEAIAETKKALEFEPNRVEALYNLGVIYYGQKDFQSSKLWFEKCIAAAPGTEIAQSARQIISSLPLDAGS